MVFYSLIFLGFLDARHIYTYVHCGHLVYDIFSRHFLAFRRHICVEGLIDGAVLCTMEVNFFFPITKYALDEWRFGASGW